jgi:hypothetical protein
MFNGLDSEEAASSPADEGEIYIAVDLEIGRKLSR